MSSFLSLEEVGLSLGGGTTGSAEVFSRVAVNRASKRENLSVSSVIWACTVSILPPISSWRVFMPSRSIFMAASSCSVASEALDFGIFASNWKELSTAAVYRRQRLPPRHTNREQHRSFTTGGDDPWQPCCFARSVSELCRRRQATAVDPVKKTSPPPRCRRQTPRRREKGEEGGILRENPTTVSRPP
jgi:hypothetical protein